MDRSQEVIWALTKKRNNQLVKFGGRHWTKSPFSMSGMWNASEAQRTVGVSGRREEKDADKKSSKRVFTISLKTKQKSGITKRADKTSQRIPGGAVVDVQADVNRAAKAIQSLTYQNDRDKKLALRKLARLSAASGSNLRGGALKLVTKGKKGKNSSK